MDRYEETKLGGTDRSDSKCNSVYDSGRIDSGFVSGANLNSERFDSEEILLSRCDLEQDSPSKSDLHSDSKFYQQQDSGLDLSDQFSSTLIIGNDLNEPSSTCIDSYTPNVPIVESATDPSSESYFNQDEDGDTYLHLAVMQYLATAVEYLCRVAQPALLDIKNVDRQTALHLAVYTRQPHVARRLVEAGASLSVQDVYGNTPLHLASLHDNVECLKALLGPYPVAATELDRANYDGMMCVHLAACSGNVDVLRYLMHSGANMNARDLKGGRTVLHLAVEHGRRDGVLQLLLEEGLQLVHLDATTYAGHTAYQLAVCGAGNEALANRLASRGAQRRPFPVDESSSDEDDEGDEEEMYQYYGSHIQQLTRNVGPINASA